MTNILNKDYFQLTMLKIKSIFYMSTEPFPDIDKHFTCIHKPIIEKQKPLIDFDELSEEVQALMKEGPVLLMCVSGQISGALAMKVVMDTNKTFTKELATAFVITKRYELNDVQTWLYQQVGPKG